MSYIQGQVRENQGSSWVRQGWSIATRRGREKKKRKERDQGRQEGGSCKGKVPCALHQEFLFLVHEYLGLEAARLGWSIGSYETWSTRKQCVKEVPETDYFTQQKQYLKRTTLRRLKILLRSIRSEEGPHYRLSEVWARKLSSDKRQSTFIHELDILRWFHTWAVLRSLANARKCQLEDFCEKERYEVMFSPTDVYSRRFSQKAEKGKVNGSDATTRFPRASCFWETHAFCTRKMGAHVWCTSAKKLASSDFAKILKVATKIRETCERTLFTPSSPVKAT